MVPKNDRKDPFVAPFFEESMEMQGSHQICLCYADVSIITS